MLGAIAGDMIGSPYEGRGRNYLGTDFPLFTRHSRFTDDTVLTVATAEVLMQGGDYAEAYRRYAHAYPDRGYGGMFSAWVWRAEAGPYGSLGNGSAMRVGPVGWARETLEEVLEEAARSAAVTHDHPEGIKGAQAIAGTVFLARTGHTKDDIRAFVSERIGYRLQGTVESLRGRVRGATCPDTVPAALLAFLEADGWEESVRLAVSVGGDSDTIACMAGAVAEAFYGGVPEPIAREVWCRLMPSLQHVARAFLSRHLSVPYASVLSLDTRIPPPG